MKEKNMVAGERLRQCRKNAHKTLEEIGTLCGVHKTTVMRWEKGDIERIGLPTIQLLASFYGVDPAWLSGISVSMEKEPPEIGSSNEKINQILKIIDELPDEKLDGVIDYLRFLNQSDT